MTLFFNYWHIIVLGVVLLIFIGGVIASFKQESKQLRFATFFSTALITIFLTFFSVLIVDKYTKKVKLYNMENKRLLSVEKIVYTGIVKNEGKYAIGEVTFEIKLVNKGHATGNIKGGNFYKSSGFMDFFTGGYNLSSKPQSITKEFVVATNLKPGQAKAFRVYFAYPPYFRNTSHFAKVYGH